MLKWSLVFFIVALIAAILGFANIAAGTIMIGRICFFLFLLLFAFTLFLDEDFRRK